MERNIGKLLREGPDGIDLLSDEFKINSVIEKLDKLKIYIY